MFLVLFYRRRTAQLFAWERGVHAGTARGAEGRDTEMAPVCDPGFAFRRLRGPRLRSSSARSAGLLCSPGCCSTGEELPDGIAPSPLVHLLCARLFDLITLLLLHGPMASVAADRLCFLNNSQRMPENVKFKCRARCCYS